MMDNQQCRVVAGIIVDGCNFSFESGSDVSGVDLRAESSQPKRALNFKHVTGDSVAYRRPVVKLVDRRKHRKCALAQGPDMKAAQRTHGPSRLGLRRQDPSPDSHKANS